jgi:hypothetical protein
VTGAEAVEIEDALTRVAPSRAFLAKAINPSISIFASSVDGAEHMRFIEGMRKDDARSITRKNECTAAAPRLDHR